MARVACPGVPHHVTQGGDRRQRAFFCDEDYGAHLALFGRALPPKSRAPKPKEKGGEDRVQYGAAEVVIYAR